MFDIFISVGSVLVYLLTMPIAYGIMKRHDWGDDEGRIAYACVWPLALIFCYGIFIPVVWVGDFLARFFDRLAEWAETVQFKKKEKSEKPTKPDKPTKLPKAIIKEKS